MPRKLALVRAEGSMIKDDALCYHNPTIFNPSAQIHRQFSLKLCANHHNPSKNKGIALFFVYIFEYTILITQMGNGIMMTQSMLLILKAIWQTPQSTLPFLISCLHF